MILGLEKTRILLSVCKGRKRKRGEMGNKVAAVLGPFLLGVRIEKRFSGIELPITHDGPEPIP